MARTNDRIMRKHMRQQRAGGMIASARRMPASLSGTAVAAQQNPEISLVHAAVLVEIGFRDVIIIAFTESI
jgi:hypothetical protein